MPKMTRFYWFLTFLLGAQVGSAQIYWEPLLRRELLCGPTAHERVECFSSRGDGLTNNDGGNYYGRDANNWNILCDIHGTGNLAEFGWTRRNPGPDLRFRIYIDGIFQPTLDVRADSLCGRTSPFLPPLADSLSGWSWNFAPIPFQERLRITYQGNSIAYHGCAIMYPEGTQLTPFSYPVSLPYFLKRDTLEALWNQPTRPFFANEQVTQLSADSTLAAFDVADLLSVSGSGVMRRLWLIPQDTTKSYVDRTVMRIYTDHNPEPAVDAQIGMLFACSEGVTTYASALTGRVGDTLYFQLPMPFSNGFRIEIENNVQTPNTNRIRIGCDVVEMAANEVPAFRLGGQVNTGVPTDRYAPFRAAEFSGRGHYIGLYWEADNTSGSVLEGDELLIADDSLVRAGLGTPEYFNGSYRWLGPNNLPALTRNYAHGIVTVTNNDFAAYRWHLTDPVPFHNSLTLDFEVGAWGHLTGNYRSIAWGYFEPKRWVVRDQDSTNSSVGGEILTLFTRGQNNGRELQRVAWNGYTCQHIQGGYVVDDSILVVRVRAPFIPGAVAPLVAEFSDGSETIDPAWEHRNAPEVTFDLRRDDIDEFATAGDTLNIEIRGYPEGEGASIFFGGVTLAWLDGLPLASEDGVISGRVTMPSLYEAMPEVRAQIEAHAISIEGFPVAYSVDYLTSVRLERFEIERMTVQQTSGLSLGEFCACDYEPTNIAQPWGRSLVRRAIADTTGEFASFNFPIRTPGNYRLSYFVGSTRQGTVLQMLVDSVLDRGDFIAWDTTLTTSDWVRSDTLRGTWRYLEPGTHVVTFRGIVPFDTMMDTEMILDQILLESEFHIEIPSVTGQRPEVPQSARLLPPYPNPFNSTTRLRFELSESANIKLEIFNLLGQSVAVLAEGRYETGSYEQAFDCTQCASGLYLARLTLPHAAMTQKMLLLK